MKAQDGGRPYQCRHWRCCDKHFAKTTVLKTHELFHNGEKYKGGEKPMCIYVSSETSTQALWVCFRWKPLFLGLFCHTLEHCATLRSKGGSQGPSQATVGQAGGDQPRSWGGSRAAQLFSQPGKDLGQPEEGGPAEQATGKSTFETGTFQNWLNPKVMKNRKKEEKQTKLKWWQTKVHTIQMMRSAKGTNDWQQPFLCEICGKVFTPTSNLRKIWSSMWGTNIKLDPTCINCGSSVIKTAGLKSHEMLHTGKKFVKCHIFGKCFHTASLIHRNFSIALLCSFQKKWS